MSSPRTPTSRYVGAPPRRTIRGLALLAVWLGTVAPLLAAAGTLSTGINAATAEARRSTGQIGVMVARVDSGREIYRYNADRLFIPASNVKLYTTATALGRLGPGYQYVTPLLMRGQIVGRVLRGDLSVVGSGDPNLSGRLHGGDGTALLRRWAEALRDRGVRTVEGDLILVDGLFDRQFVHPSWPRDQLDRWYEAPVAALSLADNCVLVRVRPGSGVGEPARVELEPFGSGLPVQGSVRTVASRARNRVWIGRAAGSETIEVRGTIALDSNPVERWVAVPDPLAYFGSVLQATLEREGVQVEGEVRRDRTVPPGEWTRVTEVRHDLLTTVEITNKRSQNFYAESILKLLGARLCDRGDSEAGVEVVRRFVHGLGAPDGWRLVDGSGMSRQNRLAPRHIVGLLLAMAEHPRGGELLRSLPYAGEAEQGRWERRLAEPPYRGNVFAKTGTLRGVSALSGYAKAVSGRLYAFSILSNGVTDGGAVDRSEDRIVRSIVNHG